MNQEASLKQLQKITLEQQGLNKTHAFGKGKKAVLSAIENLGYLQIDTLSVVERAHHHTLYTRIPDYKKEYLAQLTKERNVFEYWFHAASFLPMKDFRYVLPQMHEYKERKSHYNNNVDQKILDYAYDTIRSEGPQKARDFKSPNKKPGSWWNWKPAKMALEKLFMQGDIMVSERHGIEKIYDLTERVLPSSTNTTKPTPIEFAEYLTKTYLRAYGATSIKQITHLKKGKELKQNVAQVLQNLIDDNTIEQVTFEGTPTMFVQQDLLNKTIKKPISKIHLLSPFDNAIIHRDRLEQLFNFNYRLECYLPKEKRPFGYFCLPILFGNEFIGRIDCKAHRKNGKFELIHLHIENKQKDIEQWIKPLTEKIRQFAVFNGCQSITLTKTSPQGLLSSLHIQELCSKVMDS